MAHMVLGRLLFIRLDYLNRTHDPILNEGRECIAHGPMDQPTCYLKPTVIILPGSGPGTAASKIKPAFTADPRISIDAMQTWSQELQFISPSRLPRFCMLLCANRGQPEDGLVSLHTKDNEKDPQLSVWNPFSCWSSGGNKINVTPSAPCLGVS